MHNAELEKAIARIPSGAWGIGVSGGADSVALLRLAHARRDLRLVVVHLDHETRAGRSAGDAASVTDLARSLGLEHVSVRRAEIEPHLADPPANLSARFRACRMRLFADVAHERNLRGVLLAHHADDQAETVFQRLLRGSGPLGLGGMMETSDVGGLTIHRPLLRIGRAALRAYLEEIGQPWREDASNRSPAYQRNRIRMLLADRPALRDGLIDLATAMQTLRQWVRSTAPQLTDSIGPADIEGLPPLVAEQALRRWLADQGIPPGAIAPPVLDRLQAMLHDAASPPRQHFPGKILLRRRRGRISVEA